jgi:hypothetical protein
MPIVKVVDLYVEFYFHFFEIFIFYLYRYRHELFDNGFGIEWMSVNDDESRKTITEESINEQDSMNNHNHNNSKHSRPIISVRSINNNATRLPAHIWRSLAKVSYVLSLV